MTKNEENAEPATFFFLHHSLLKRAAILNEHLGYQYANAVQQRHGKYTFCRAVFLRVHVVGKQGNVGDQAPNTKKRNQAFLRHERTYKIAKRRIAKTHQVDN